MSNAVQGVLSLSLLAACGVRARTLRAAGGRFSNARLACVAAGVVLAIAAIYGLDGPGRRLLYWHTLQRLSIGDAAGLLIALGLAGAAAPRGRRLLRRRPSPLTQPWVALALWAVNLAVWQLPGPFDASMHHGPLRVVSNALLLLLSVNMWLALLPRLSRRRPLSDAARVPYVLIGRAIGAGLACVAIWSPDVYYPYYLRGDTVSSTSPLADQGIAGAIMLGEMALVAIVLLCWLRTRLGGDAATAPAPQRAESALAVSPIVELAVSGKAASNSS